MYSTTNSSTTNILNSLPYTGQINKEKGRKIFVFFRSSTINGPVYSRMGGELYSFTVERLAEEFFNCICSLSDKKKTRDASGNFFRELLKNVDWELFLFLCVMCLQSKAFNLWRNFQH